MGGVKKGNVEIKIRMPGTISAPGMVLNQVILLIQEE
jgi:hypothetical protein